MTVHQLLDNSSNNDTDGDHRGRATEDGRFLPTKSILSIVEQSKLVMHKDLFLLLRQYAALVSPRSINFPNHFPLSVITEFIVEHIITNPHFHQYPPAKQFQQQWWKRMISLLEEHITDQEDEIDPRIFDHYLSLLPSSGPPSGSIQPEMRNQICARGIPVREPPSRSFVTHFWRSASDSVEEIDLKEYQTTTLHESRTLIESGTTGLRTWPASHTMGQYLIDHPELVQNARILELGSGIGFLGIIAATLQQLSSKDKNENQCIWLTDVNEDVLSQCHHNVQLPCNLSSIHSAIHYRALDWYDALDPNTSSLERLFRDEVDPDLILGADIVFDPSLVPPLAALINLALQSGSKDRRRRALIALTIRNRETFDLFLRAVKEHGLDVKDVEFRKENSMFVDSMQGSEESRNDVRILRIESTSS